MNEGSGGLDWRGGRTNLGRARRRWGEGETEGRLTREEEEAGGKAAKRKWDVMNGGRQGASQRK